MTTGVIPTDRKPTRRQLDILEFIARSIAGGTTPTIREVGAEFGIASTSTVNYHLDRLERHGLIDRGPAFAYRRVRLTAAGRAHVSPDALAPAERIAAAAIEAQAAGEPLPARVVAALTAVA